MDLWKGGVDSDDRGHFDDGDGDGSDDDRDGER